jgi:diguanylate cyclase (GGDEF)-like protein
MSHLAEIFADRYPRAAAVVLAVVFTAVLLLPMCAVRAIVEGHPVTAVTLLLVNGAVCALGYAAVAARYRRRCRAAVADARRDPLTGLPNRAAADEALRRATRERIPISVALVDVDGLHALNARFGHAAGDQILTALAARLSSAVPAGGLLVRQGGDEFTLLAPEADAMELALMLGAALSGPAPAVENCGRPQASVGIAASGPVGGADAAGGAGRSGDAGYARGCADAALCSAKAAGGNQILVYDADRDGVPTPEGVRPPRRRRDLGPGAEYRAAWLPAPAGDLVPLLWPVADLSRLHRALDVAAAWWAQAADDARAGDARRPAPPATAPTPTGSKTITIEPTLTEQQALAGIAEDQQQAYRRLADRLAPLLDATVDLDELPAAAGMAAAVLVGVSAAFPPPDLEQLVIVAAHAAHGDGTPLSARQRRLAKRAHTLLGL